MCPKPPPSAAAGLGVVALAWELGPPILSPHAHPAKAWQGRPTAALGITATLEGTVG